MLVKMFMKLKKSWKLLIRDFNSTYKTGFLNINIRNKWKWISLFLFHDWFPHHDAVRNKVQAINIYTRVDKKKIKSSKKEYIIGTCLKFSPMKTFSENCNPLRVWLWLVYNFTENYCRLRLFSEFIHTQKSHPTSIDKIGTLT